MPRIPLPHHLMTSLPEDSPAVNVLVMDEALHLNDSRARTAFWTAAATGTIAAVLTFTIGELVWLATILSISCIVAAVMMSRYRKKTREIREFYARMATAVQTDLEAGTTFSDEEMSVFNKMMTNTKEGCTPTAQSAIIGLLIGVLIIFVPMRINFESDGSETGAISACQDTIALQLKNPSSASFSNSTASKKGNREWLVRGTVRGTNSFGAVVAAPYICSVTWNGSKYTAIGSIEE